MRIGLAGAGRIGARHAQALRKLPEITDLLVADAEPDRARALAVRLSEHGSGMDAARDGAQGDPRVGAQDGAQGAARGAAQDAAQDGTRESARVGGRGGARVAAMASVAALFEHELDGLVVAAATDAHAELVIRATQAGLPVFCEKPLAVDLNGTLQVVREIRQTPVQVGFQRRFDAGHAAIREAVAAGRLGWLHTLRSCTFDPAPPPPEYIPHSGGLFRDCGVHDFDAIRFVTGREVVQVMAVGGNRGDGFFREYGDVDTAAAVLTMDDGALALVSATRYNAAGYDVRLEVFGSKDSVVAGLDERTPLTPAGAAAPSDPYSGFMERFAPAYDAELRAFADVVQGKIDSPCPPSEALEACYVAEACEMSRLEARPVAIAEIRELAHA